MTNDKNNNEQEIDETIKSLEDLNKDADSFLDDLDKRIEEADHEFAKDMLEGDEELLKAAK